MYFLTSLAGSVLRLYQASAPPAGMGVAAFETLTPSPLTPKINLLQLFAYYVKINKPSTNQACTLKLLTSITSIKIQETTY